MGDMRIALLLAALAVAALGLAGCATAGPFAACNPIMTRCNPGDLAPLTAQLPQSPIPPAASRWVEVYGDQP